VVPPVGIGNHHTLAGRRWADWLEEWVEDPAVVAAPSWQLVAAAAAVQALEQLAGAAAAAVAAVAAAVAAVAAAAAVAAVAAVAAAGADRGSLVEGTAVADMTVAVVRC